MKKKASGSHFKKKKSSSKEEAVEEVDEDIFFSFYFSFLTSLTSLFDIWQSDRQNSSGQEAKCSTRCGLRVGTKNTGFHRVFN